MNMFGIRSIFTVRCNSGQGIVLKNIDDLVTAGMMSLAGKIESVDNLSIRWIDLTNVPIGIVNSLIKIVKGMLMFEEGVDGLCICMLENIQCEELTFSRAVKLPEPSEMQQDFCFNGKITLIDMCAIKGMSEFLNFTTCEHLILDDVSLKSEGIKSLTDMLKERVRKLSLCGLTTGELGFILANYDGQGQCETFFFAHFHDLYDIGSIESTFLHWAKLKGWNVTKCLDFGYYGREIKRETHRS